MKNYFLGGQLPLPPPDGFPVVLGPLTGLHPLLLLMLHPLGVFVFESEVSKTIVVV